MITPPGEKCRLTRTSHRVAGSIRKDSASSSDAINSLLRSYNRSVVTHYLCKT